MPSDLGWAKHGCEKKCYGFPFRKVARQEFFLRKQTQIPGNNMGVINEMWK